MNPIFALLLNLTGTVVSLHPTISEKTVAEVRIYNFGMNNARDNGVYPVAMENGFTIEVEFQWNAEMPLAADRFIVYPPDGVICEPIDCTATLAEGANGLIILKPYEGF